MAETLNSLEDLGDAAAPVQDSAAPVYVQKIDAQGRAYSTGKRKDAVARVWVKRGAGRITINGKAYNEYFARPVLQMILQQPIVAADRRDQYDIELYVLPKQLDEEVARLHLEQLGVKLTTLTQDQADYLGVPVEGPYKPEEYRY